MAIPLNSPASIALVVILVVSVQVLAAVSGYFAPMSCAKSPKAPSQPPGIVFAIVWPILYLCIALGLWLQVVSPDRQVSKGVQYAGIVLMLLQLVASFAWSPVFVYGNSKAATWLIVAMLLIGVPGLVLAAKTNIASGALWAPYMAWLVFALILSSQINAMEGKIEK